MIAAKPNLTVDVNAAQQRNTRGGRSNSTSGSGAGPSSVAAAGATANNVAGGRSSIERQQQQQQRGNYIRTGDIVSEEDLAAQNGFGSDEDTQDIYDGAGKGVRGAIQRQGQGQAQGFSLDSQDFVDSDSSDGDEYGHGQDDEMGSEDDDDLYDDEEELSSSPSIPDENIDFDLVYALHNFIATVEGQATVSKGNSLTLLDDSNSYWWLVRVLRTQEVGYIPAENIETPYERLARLNKHRNVDLTSATDDDHNQIPDKVYTSHLVKSRAAAGAPKLSTFSGKPSALSRRSYGPIPSKGTQDRQRGVVFGEPIYVEQSEYEYSDDEEEDDEDGDEEDNMIDIDDEQDEDEDGDDEDDEEYEDEHEEEDRGQQENVAAGVDRGQNVAGIGAGAAAASVAAGAGTVAAGASMMRGNQSQQQGPVAMQTDDRALSDAREGEVAGQMQAQRSNVSGAPGAGQDQTQAAYSPPTGANNVSQSINAQPSQNAQQPQQQPSRLQQALLQPQQSPQQMQLQQQGLQQQPAQQQTQVQPRGQSLQHRNSRGQVQGAAQNTQRVNQPSSSVAGPSAPAQSPIPRERSASDIAAMQGQNAADANAQNKADKRTSHRKSRSEDEIMGSGNEDKQTKKRSGVFSGLFSRSKDKKERKTGHSSASSIDAGDSSRTSEESNGRNSYIGSGARGLQERDRVQQEAFSRQFLAADGAKNPRQRPGSLVGPPGTGPMLNVLRIFAGNDIHSGATFKTVLLNESTMSSDLVRQAVQRFRLGSSSDMDNFYLTVKSVEGDERTLHAEEKPLQVFDQLTETLAMSNRDTPTSTMPSVKRSSVGSISSISSNLSLNPAIARLDNDFSDDHNVKFYLHRRGNNYDNGNSTQSSNERSGELSSSRSAQSDGLVNGQHSEDSALGTPTQAGFGDRAQDAGQSQRFALRLLVFPSDLPEGLVFDPQSNALIPQKLLAERGARGQEPLEGISQDYREKHLALPRNVTVAEVIELGLDRFGILEGVVEGGDNVEDRASRRRSKGRVRFGLCVKVPSGERPLPPNSNVLDAYPLTPTFRSAPLDRRSKRLSTDSAMVLSYFGEAHEDDPVFILRQVQRHRHSARPLSPTENVLAAKQDQRRQAELDSVSAPGTKRAADPSTMAQQGMSRQEIIAAQRAAARERRAAVLGTQMNDTNGVDVMLDDRSRLRSSRIMETGKMRYSFIPPESGEEYDISAIIEDVLGDENSTTPRAPPGPSRSISGISGAEYVSAPNTPTATSPIPLEEVNMTSKPSFQSLRGVDGKRDESRSNVPGLHSDALHTLMQGRHPAGAVADRIDEVLSRIDAKTPTQAAAPNKATVLLNSNSVPSSHGTASPTSNYTQQSGTTTPTPLSTFVSASAGGAALAAGVAAAAAAVNNDGRLRSALGASTPDLTRQPAGSGMLNTDSRNGTPRLRDAPSATFAKLPAPSPATTDFGVSHLFAITEAAARKRPPTRTSSRAHARMTSNLGQYPRSSTYSWRGDDETNFKPTVAGLFPPQAPYIEDRRVKEAYAPIGRNLNALEDSLDKLLADVMKASF